MPYLSSFLYFLSMGHGLWLYHHQPCSNLIELSSLIEWNSGWWLPSGASQSPKIPNWATSSEPLGFWVLLDGNLFRHWKRTSLQILEIDMAVAQKMTAKAYGLFIFCFAGHPCFPALHEGMKEVKQWTSCASWLSLGCRWCCWWGKHGVMWSVQVALSFCIAALYYATRLQTSNDQVISFYIPIPRFFQKPQVALGLAAFIVLGSELHPVFTKDMSSGLLGKLTVAFFVACHRKTRASRVPQWFSLRKFLWNMDFGQTGQSLPWNWMKPIFLFLRFPKIFWAYHVTEWLRPWRSSWLLQCCCGWCWSRCKFGPKVGKSGGKSGENGSLWMWSCFVAYQQNLFGLSWISLLDVDVFVLFGLFPRPNRGKTPTNLAPGKATRKESPGGWPGLFRIKLRQSLSESRSLYPLQGHSLICFIMFHNVSYTWRKISAIQTGLL